MTLTDDQIKTILLNALDEFKERVRRHTFSDKIGDGVAMMAMPITPARPGLPAGVVMLAVSELSGFVDEITQAFDRWGTQSKP